MADADDETLADVLADSSVCNDCLARRPLDEFHADKQMPNGRRAVCKICRSRRRRQHRTERRDKAEHRAWSRIVRAIDSGKLNGCAQELVDGLLAAAGGPRLLGAVVGNHLLHAKPGASDACRAFAAATRLLVIVAQTQPVAHDSGDLSDGELAEELVRAGVNPAP